MPPYPDPIYELAANKGAPSGYPSLGPAGEIPENQIPTLPHGQLSELDQDQHPQYQKVSGKGQINGYAPLDGIGVVPHVHLPDDVTLAADLAAHEAAADPHAGYQKESQQGQPNGYPNLDANGTVPGSQLPLGFFGWNSISTGVVAATQSAIYTVPADKATNVTFLSIRNTSAVTQTVDVLIHRSGQTPVSVGTVELRELDYAWYVEINVESWALSEGDAVEAVSTNVDSCYYVLLGSTKDVV